MKIQFAILVILTLLFSCNNSRQSKKNAEHYFNDNDYVNALLEINKAIKFEPDSISHYSLRLKIYELTGNYKEEVSDLSKIIEINKKSGSKSLNAHHLRAIAQVHRGLYNEALLDIDYFIENRDTVGVLAVAYLYKALILYKLNDNKESKKYYELVLKENVNDKKQLKLQALVGLANLEKSPQKAIKILDKVILAYDESSLAYVARAELYYDLGKIREAYDDSRKAYSLNPNNATANFLIGQLFANYSDNLDSALIYFDKAIQVSPQSSINETIYLNKGVVNSRLNNLEDAMTDYQKGEAINPKNDLLLYNFAFLLSDMGRNNDALIKVSKAIQYNNKDPEYYNLKGTILLDLSKFNEAETCFLEAIKLKPNYGIAYYNLGYLNGKIGNHSKSINYYGKAVKLDFNLEATLVNMATQKIKLNKISSACSDLRKAYKLGRKDIKPLMDKYCSKTD